MVQSEIEVGQSGNPFLSTPREVPLPPLTSETEFPPLDTPVQLSIQFLSFRKLNAKSGKSHLKMAY
jgi:hypothetical protein